MDDFVEFEELRETFLLSLPKLPFPPDHGIAIPTNTIPSIVIQQQWDWSKDDFPEGFSNDFDLFLKHTNNNNNNNNIQKVDFGTLEEYQIALHDLEQAMIAASTLSWTKEKIKEQNGKTNENNDENSSIPKVWCHREIEGTVCAVHRWNAKEQQQQQQDQTTTATSVTTSTSSSTTTSNNDIVGRLQCWNDPGLTISDPTFLRNHPEFEDADGEGSTCVLEMVAKHQRDDNEMTTTAANTNTNHDNDNDNDNNNSNAYLYRHYFFAMSFPAGCVKVATNRILIQENWDVGWELEIPPSQPLPPQTTTTTTTNDNHNNAAAEEESTTEVRNVLEKMHEILKTLCTSKQQAEQATTTTTTTSTTTRAATTSTRNTEL